MLLSVNTLSKHVERRQSKPLQSFGFDELALQDILFKSLDRLFPEEELLLLMQSRAWQEEPDLMAVDKNGTLYIFELKAWESNNLNLLQVLRYGQLYGGSDYEDLASLYRNVADSSQTLSEAHEAKFGVQLGEDDFNRRQVFVTITNGLDYRTREAVQYWRSAKLDVRPWIYRVYEGDKDEMLLELSPFRVGDNPYEDIAEGYYIHNTNSVRGPEDHENMLASGKISAYFEPWKYTVERLSKGDVIFLYHSGVGIVAVGEADGKLRKSAYQGDPNHMDEEYFMLLNRFQRVSPPMTAAEVKRIAGTNYRFMQTQFAISGEAGKAIRKALHNEGRLVAVETPVL